MIVTLLGFEYLGKKGEKNQSLLLSEQTDVVCLDWLVEGP